MSKYDLAELRDSIEFESKFITQINNSIRNVIIGQDDLIQKLLLAILTDGHVFIEGFTSALRADAAWNSGHYAEPPAKGVRAMARVYAGWGLSQAWYREELYKHLGHPSVEDFLVYFWENFFLQCDANNLLAQAKTWQNHNVGDTPGFDGDWKKALANISAKAMVMSGQTDLYFPVDDNEAKWRKMKKNENAAR